MFFLRGARVHVVYSDAFLRVLQKYGEMWGFYKFTELRSITPRSGPVYYLLNRQWSAPPAPEGIVVDVFSALQHLT